MKVTQSNSEVTLRLPKSLTGKNCRNLAQSVSESVLPPYSRIVVDMSDTGFIDSAGIGSLLGLSRTFGEEEIPVYLGGLQPHVHQLFREVGLTRVFSIISEDEWEEPAEGYRNSGLVCNNELHSTGIVLRVGGELNYPDGCNHLREEILLASSKSPLVILDFEYLSSFDQLGISVIINTATLLSQDGKRLRVTGTNPITREIKATVPDNDELIRNYPDIASAVAW